MAADGRFLSALAAASRIARGTTCERFADDPAYPESMTTIGRVVAILALLLASSPAFAQRWGETVRNTPRDTPEGIHGWMAYLRTLSIETTDAGSCSGDLLLLVRTRVPYFDISTPEVRSATELYRDDDDPIVRLHVRMPLAQTLEDAEDLLRILKAGGCVQHFHNKVATVIETLASTHGEKADPEKHHPLFAVAQGAKVEPQYVWGRFAKVETRSGCVVDSALYVEIDDVWRSPWS